MANVYKARKRDDSSPVQQPAGESSLQKSANNWVDTQELPAIKMDAVAVPKSKTAATERRQYKASGAGKATPPTHKAKAKTTSRKPSAKKTPAENPAEPLVEASAEKTEQAGQQPAETQPAAKKQPAAKRAVRLAQKKYMGIAKNQPAQPRLGIPAQMMASRNRPFCRIHENRCGGR